MVNIKSAIQLHGISPHLSRLLDLGVDVCLVIDLETDLEA